MIGVATVRTEVPGDSGRGARAARLTRADWVEAATATLAADGLVGVAVEPIAARLGVTKGSFYSHFGSRQDLVEAVLHEWQRTDTDDILSALQAVEDPRAQLHGFLDFSYGRRQWGQVFAALCASASDPLVEPTMIAVREARLTYLRAALLGLGLAPEDADDRAALLYASYVGFWRLVAADPDWEPGREAHLQRFADHVKSALIPS